MIKKFLSGLGYGIMAAVILAAIGAVTKLVATCFMFGWHLL